MSIRLFVQRIALIEAVPMRKAWQARSCLFGMGLSVSGWEITALIPRP